MAQQDPPIAAGVPDGIPDGIPGGLTLALDAGADTALRAELGRRINAFHARTVPLDGHRFALSLRDGAGTLAGGLSGVVGWGWLFVEALWVDEARRGQGCGRVLLAAAERHAALAGCGWAWLDTFQAPGFYRRQGYAVFAALPDYPPGQARVFLKKKLAPAPD
jgi:GNAT superfamily N-acetyltransferase